MMDIFLCSGGELRQSIVDTKKMKKMMNSDKIDV